MLQRENKEQTEVRISRNDNSRQVRVSVTSTNEKSATYSSASEARDGVESGIFLAYLQKGSEAMFALGVTIDGLRRIRRGNILVGVPETLGGLSLFKRGINGLMD